MNWLVIARFLSGGMAAAIIPLAFAWIGDAFSFATRQAVLARFLSAQFTGIVLGQAVGGFIGDVFGWRSVFLIVGAIHFIAGACMLIELKTNPGAQPVAAPAMTGWRTTVAAIGDLLASPWVRVMLGVVFLEAFAMYGAFAYIGATCIIASVWALASWAFCSPSTARAHSHTPSPPNTSFKISASADWCSRAARSWRSVMRCWRLRPT
ncbi:MAG: MFS transporter [Sphingomonadales bacterium]|nr:MFS transporter [Sphingomonadales bacterium]